jgi:prepilin-type N-terminal cleavage/methylation domain-containing protein
MRSAPPARRRSRRGLTLFELLIVLTIMGISAGVVVMRGGAGLSRVREAPLTRARRLAVSRAEVLRLVVREDGAWTLLSPDGTALDEGTEGGAPVDVQLDALGSCHPMPAAEANPPRAGFDPLTCRWRDPA